MKSKYRGVTWHKTCKKWLSKIEHNRELIRIGLFDSEIEAGMAYDRLAIELKGDCAKLNFGDNVRYCEVCRREAFTKYKNEIWLCNKHNSQMKQFGKIFDRTIFDPNEILVNEEYSEIVLYNRKNVEIEKVKIDTCKISEVENFKWYLRPDGYVATNNYNGDYVYLHRLIIGESKSCNYIDHIDRNKLNCRADNLRVVNYSQNGMNKGLDKRNKSGKKGVYWCNLYEKWVVQIGFYNKRKAIGKFDNLNEAIEARIKAEEEYHKEYSPQNERNI